MQSDSDSQEPRYQRVTVELRQYDHRTGTQHPFSTLVDPKQWDDRRPSLSVRDAVRLPPSRLNLHHGASAD
jgi:hypothetical protein